LGSAVCVFDENTDDGLVLGHRLQKNGHGGISIILVSAKRPCGIYSLRLKKHVPNSDRSQRKSISCLSKNILTEFFNIPKETADLHNSG
jgi:hypothetical protein